MATINPSQDYDIVQTLTFTSSGGTCKISLWRGYGSEVSGTVYYRSGTSGAWTSLSVSGSSTTFPIGSTTMQVAHDWNKSGNDYMTCSFAHNTKIKEIAIAQKAVLSGTMGDSFMYEYAWECTALTSLDVPDISNVTSVGGNFMVGYADTCTSLTSLSTLDTSNITAVGDYFMQYYAYDCTSLTSLVIPDTSSFTSVGSNFMEYFLGGCTALIELILPKAGWFKTNNVNWSVPSSRLGVLKGKVQDSADLSDWQGLVTSGKTLHTNYIRDTANVVLHLTNGCVFYYKLDNDTVNSTGGDDASGSNLTYSTGKINDAGSFGGVNSELSIPLSSAGTFSGTNKYTISYWVYFNALSTQIMLVDFTENPNDYKKRSVHMAVEYPSKKIVSSRWNGTKSAGKATSTTTISTDTWYHVATVYNGSRIYLYINGVLESSQLDTNSVLSPTSRRVMGRLFETGSYYYPLNGMLDEVGIWNRALTSTEISELYNGGSGLSYPFSTPPPPPPFTISPIIHMLQMI